jgi:hypothetical protein
MYILDDDRGDRTNIRVCLFVVQSPLIRDNDNRNDRQLLIRSGAHR